MGHAAHLLRIARERAAQIDEQRRDYRRSHDRLRAPVVRDRLRLFW